ncbi:MAG: nucleotidyltransferase domain-containing protein [Bacteroidota bacterium]
MGNDLLNDLNSGGARTGPVRVLNDLEKAFVQTLLYFDIFQYPLRKDELLRTCRRNIDDPPAAAEILDQLVGTGLIIREEGFHYIGAGAGYVERRKQGNARADFRMKKARKVSRFIAKFPYVRGVMLSGSISKNYMEPDSDIDYFIVTQPGRLWVARTLLVLYKKVFLLNSHRNFCVNYFVDTDHLMIEDKNLFTATEMIYLLPTCNAELYHRLRGQNKWADEFYPNFGFRETEACHPEQSSLLGRGLEKILGGRLGERIDTWCMQRTFSRWQHKFAHFDPERFEITLRTRKYVSKHHPANYQQYVTNSLRKKAAEFERTHRVKL